jgi:hypothetical protein
VIDISTLSDLEIAEIKAQIKAHARAPVLPVLPDVVGAYPPAGKTEAKPLNAGPPSPPSKTDAERISALETEIAGLKSALRDMVQRAWAEVELMRDQIRAELRRPSLPPRGEHIRTDTNNSHAQFEVAPGVEIKTGSAVMLDHNGKAVLALQPGRRSIHGLASCKECDGQIWMNQSGCWFHLDPVLTAAHMAVPRDTP